MGKFFEIFDLRIYISNKDKQINRQNDAQIGKQEECVQYNAATILKYLMPFYEHNKIYDFDSKMKIRK